MIQLVCSNEAEYEYANNLFALMPSVKLNQSTNAAGLISPINGIEIEIVIDNQN